MNRMDKIAELLGIKIGDSICIIINDTYIYFTFAENGLIDSYGNFADSILVSLLRDDIRFFKKPWKPKDGEKYFIPTLGNTTNIECKIWGDAPREDEIAYKTGIICKTEEEAYNLYNQVIYFVKEKRKFV